MAIINGDNSSNTLNGTNGADMIYGRRGGDILNGRDGADVLEGGDDDDVVEGGAGADELFGGAGLDFASYRSSGSAVVIDLSNFIFEGGHANGDHLYSIEGVIGSAFDDRMWAVEGGNVFRGEGGNDTLSGSQERDTFEGGEGNDHLTGFGGNDILDGGSGHDFLIGSAGDDELRGGTGTDTVGFGYISSGVVADLSSGTARGDASIGNDRLFGIENLYGTTLADRLAGNSAANTLTGSSGQDVLTGRGGADRFVYESRYDSNPKAPDLIQDFSRAQGDRIDLRGVDANEQVNGNQAFQFIGQSQFTAAGQLRFYQENGDTYVEANISEAIGGAELVFVLEPQFSPRAGDFFL